LTAIDLDGLQSPNLGSQVANRTPEQLRWNRVARPADPAGGLHEQAATPTKQVTNQPTPHFHSRCFEKRYHCCPTLVSFFIAVVGPSVTLGSQLGWFSSQRVYVVSQNVENGLTAVVTAINHDCYNRHCLVYSFAAQTAHEKA
jgi:hypothetical protein